MTIHYISEISSYEMYEEFLLLSIFGCMHMTQFVFPIVVGYIFVTRECVDCVVVLSARKVSRFPFRLLHLSLQRIVLYGMSP